MSLFALFHERTRPDRREINDALAGNLCRCTGYGPIVTAAENMYDSPRRDQFTAAQATTLAALGRLQDGETATVSGDSRRFFAPTRLDELARLVGEQPTATLLAGGTDVGLWVTKQHRPLDPVIYIGNVVELQRIDIAAANIEIGAAVTYADLHELIDRHYPDFGGWIRRLGSPDPAATRHHGRNVQRSPIGDSPPRAPFALVLRSSRRRECPRGLLHRLWQAGPTARRFVELIRPPLPDPAGSSTIQDLKRFDQTSPPRWAPSTSRSQARGGHIAFGGMAPTPKRALACEAALKGKPWTRATVAEGQLALRSDYTPITDMRASQAYRSLAAEKLLLKFFIETTDADAETRVVGERRRTHG
jgi:xanthine dehydrogenase small subunit